MKRSLLRRRGAGKEDGSAVLARARRRDDHPALVLLGLVAEHGYRTQLERYKKAAETDYGIFVVIDYGRGGHKIRSIERLKNQLLQQGQRASEIVVINARKKASASKMK